MSRHAATMRGLAVFALVWQGLWLISDANLRRIATQDPGTPAVLILALSMLAWLAIWPTLFGPLRNDRVAHALQLLTTSLVVVAGFLLLTDSQAVGSDGWFVGASVLNLGAGLAGLYLDRRQGVAAVIAIVAMEVVSVVFTYSRGNHPWPIQIDMVFPFYALALGMASVAARHALSVSARAHDLSLSRLSRQRRARVETEAFDQTVAIAQNRLHETVLNTLTAIVRGGLPGDEATQRRMRERSLESAQVLRSLADGTDVAMHWNQDLRVDLAGAIVDLENAGVTVRAQGVLDVDELEDRLDPLAYAAMGSAVREVLNNCLRHSGAGSIRIRGRVHREHGRAWWQVRVSDDGRGFDVGHRGYGLRVVVVDGLAMQGGGAVIDSSPGAGTVVTLDVPLTGSPAGAEADGGGSARAIALPVVGAFGAFTLYSVGATWQYVTVPWANLAAAAAFVGLVAAIVLPTSVTRRPDLPRWVLAIVLVGVPVMTRLEFLAEPGPNPTGDWTSEAGAALLFVIVATGPWWVFPAAVASWFIAQEFHWIELTQPGMIVIVVAAILGWQLRRAKMRTTIVEDEVTQVRQALAASQQRLANAHHRYRDVDTSALIALLEGIASGSIDPANENVRRTCLLEERMIRSVMRLHPERVRLHRDLVLLAAAARDARVDLSISVTEDVESDATLQTLDDALGLLRASRPGSQARASVVSEDDACVFRLIVDVDVARCVHLPASAEILDANVVSLEERFTLAPEVPPTSLVPTNTQLSVHGGVDGGTD